MDNLASHHTCSPLCSHDQEMLFTVLFFLVLVLSPRVVNTKAFIFGISMCEADARVYVRFFFIDLYQIFDKFYFF